MKFLLIINLILLNNFMNIQAIDKNDLMKLSYKFHEISELFWNKTVENLFPDYVTCRIGFKYEDRNCKIYFDRMIQKTKLAPVIVADGKRNKMDTLMKFGEQLTVYARNMERMINISSEGLLYTCSRSSNKTVCEYYCYSYIRFYKKYLCLIESNLLPSLRQTIEDFNNLLNYEPFVNDEKQLLLEFNNLSPNIDLFFLNFVMSRALQLQTNEIIHFSNNIF